MFVFSRFLQQIQLSAFKTSLGRSVPGESVVWDLERCADTYTVRVVRVVQSKRNEYDRNAFQSGLTWTLDSGVGLAFDVLWGGYSSPRSVRTIFATVWAAPPTFDLVWTLWLM